MKISETTSFPYPVLAPWSDDIQDPEFVVDIHFREELESQQVSINCHARISNTDIVKLIEDGFAAFGCYLRCPDTGLRRVQPLGFPTSVHHFAAGDLLGAVHIRPMIWSTKVISNYLPLGMHSEFQGPYELSTGWILALGDEQIVDVSRPPLPTVESIFQIVSSSDLEEYRFEIDTSADRIKVTMGIQTYKLVQTLREHDFLTRAVVMNALFVPMVMEVLQQLSETGAGLDQYRWADIFRSHCTRSGVTIPSINLLSDAQKLLEDPFSKLEAFMTVER